MNRLQMRMWLWVSILALGMICLACAPRAPKPGASLPSPRVEQPSVLPEIPAPPPAGTPSPSPPNESAPALIKTPSAPPQPTPGRQETAPDPSIQVSLEPGEAFYRHTVKWKGETLSIIAAWYTGDWKNWMALAQGNPRMNPHVIRGGDEILIPDHLLKTRDPLPKEFVDRFYGKGRKDKSQPDTRSNQGREDEPKLFGPKKYPTR